MIHRHDADWWSIEIPDGWRAERDESCTSIFSDGNAGALQFSTYQKETDPVTNDDLHELVLEESLGTSSIIAVNRGDFDGLSTHYREAGRYWRKVWLKNGNILLYVTYNCSIGSESGEKDLVDNMLHTLKRL